MNEMGVDDVIKQNLKGNTENEILLKILKTKNNTIQTLLEEISSNQKLTQEEKNSYYFKIVNYVDEINQNLKNTIDDIYITATNETINSIKKGILSIYPITNFDKFQDDLIITDEELNEIKKNNNWILNNKNYNHFFYDK